MIATASSIGHGSVKLNYDASKTIGGQHVATEFYRHLIGGDTPSEIAEEMRDVQISYRPKLKNGFLDMVVTLSEEDAKKITTRQQGLQIVNGFMRRLMMEQLHLSEEDYQNLQWVAYQHNRTDHNERLLHWHILCNRVTMNGKLINDHHIGLKAVATINALNEELGLSNPKEISEHNKQWLHKVAINALQRMYQYRFDEYAERLTKNNIGVRGAYSSKGKLQGYYLIMPNGVEYKASAVSRDLTLSRLEATYARLHRRNVDYRMDYRQTHKTYLAHCHGHGRYFFPRGHGGPLDQNRENEVGAKYGKSWDDMTDEERELKSKGYTM
jgi:hypothetical protein